MRKYRARLRDGTFFKKNKVVFIGLIVLTLIMVTTYANAVLSSNLYLTGEGIFIPKDADLWDYPYTGNCEEFTAPKTAVYQVELWGAQGGPADNIPSNQYGGKGGYTKGEIVLDENEIIYVCVGQSPTTYAGGFNGGGSMSSDAIAERYGAGGATDIRLASGDWDNTTGLNSRIMVAGAGGGQNGSSASVVIKANSGAGGGLISENGKLMTFTTLAVPSGLTPGTGASQTSGGIGGAGSVSSGYNLSGKSGSFGKGADSGNPYAYGGGGGYYGGASASAYSNHMYTATGGSSYISGHTGSVAITSETDQTPKTGCTTGTTDNNCSIHYSYKTFNETKMIDGNGYAWTNTQDSLELMPDPTGGTYASGEGHTGNGYARITLTDKAVPVPTNILNTSTSTSFLGTDITSANIKTITLKTNKITPANVVSTYDVGTVPGEIIAWVDSSNNLVIGADGIIEANLDSEYLFANFTSVTAINGLDNLDTSNVTDMRAMFMNVPLLATLDLSSFDTSKVTNMASMFRGFTVLNTLDLSNFDTSSLTSMNSMFYTSSSITNLDVSSFDTSKVTDMQAAFSEMSSLTSLDVTNFDTSNVTIMSSMFYTTSSLTSLDVSSFNTSNVTTMAYMFARTALTSLNLSNFNTSNVTTMNRMFMQSRALKTINLSSFNTSNVTDMTYMFSENQAQTSLNISNFDTSKVTSIIGMFQNMTSLTTLDFRNATFGAVTNYTNMFTGAKTGATVYTLNTTTKSWLQNTGGYTSGNYIIP